MSTHAYPVIAVIGLSGAFPGARDVPTFWQQQAAGHVASRRLSPEALRAAGVPEAQIQDPNYVPVVSMLEDFDCFDAEFFGIAPREAVMMDPQHRLALEHAYAALENAGYRPRHVPHSTGLYLGIGYNNYMLHYVQYANRSQDANGELAVLLGNDKSYAATRIAHRLNLRGPCMAVDTACSTSLVAVHQACAALLAHECDIALAGGARVLLPPGQGYPYVEGGVYARDGLCAPFDARAAGTLQGSGVGMVVLRRLEDALADGDPIQALIRASAINNDGSGKIDYAAPSVSGQAEVIEAVLALADIDPALIRYVETHGTGTALGDPIEFAALQRAFKKGAGARRDRCFLGGVKANIGHLDAAAGVTGLINAIGVLQHRQVPPLANFERINPRIDIEQSVFAIPTTPQTLNDTDGALFAAVSSFGIGGTNAHVLLESAPKPERVSPGRRFQALPLSARSPDALAELARSMGGALLQQSDLEGVAATLQQARDPHAWRGVLVADDLATVSQRWTQDTHAWLAECTDCSTPPSTIVFQFPGQGTLPPAAAAALYQAFPAFAKLLDQALAVAPSGVRERLLDESGAADRDDETEQVALVVFQFALAQCLISLGLQPGTVLGHSLGEYVAAAIAGVFDLKALIRIVSARGRAMTQMPTGAMLSMALSESQTRQWLERFPALDLAAINASNQCVVAGDPEAVNALEQAASAAGVLCKRLGVQRAFHSRYTEPVLPAFGQAFAGLRLDAPKLELISNVVAAPVTDAVTTVDYWLRHLRAPVQYARGIEKLAQRDNVLIVEIGSGQVLTSLARAQGVAARQTLALLPQDARGSEHALLRSLGQLWQLGLPLQWSKLDPGRKPRRVALPGYPFARKRHWLDLVPSDWQHANQWHEQGDTAGADGRVASSQTLVDTGPVLSTAVWRRLPTIRFAAPTQSSSDRVIVHHEHEAAWSAVLADALGARSIKWSRLEQTLQGDTESSELGPLQVVYVLPEARTVSSMMDMQFVERLESGLLELFKLANTCASSTRPVHLLLLSRCAFDVFGDGVTNPLHAAWVAASRSVAQEHPELALRVLDLPDTDHAECVLEQLSQCLADCDGISELALRFGQCWQEVFEPLPMPVQQVPVLKSGGRYLVLGGLGGVGRTLLDALTQESLVRDAELILVGRSELPARDEWPALLATSSDAEMCARIRCIEQLEARRLRVTVHAIDLSDLKAWDTFLERVGQVNGVVHALGQAASGLARARQESVLQRVLRAKLLPMLALLRQPALRSADFVLLVSSLASLVGGPGQADYAAANAVLDTFARIIRTPKLIAVSWDQWANTGMAQAQTDLRWWDRASAPPSWVAAVANGRDRFRVSVATDWCLREHVLADVPVLPGTAMIELFLHGAKTSALSDVQWLNAATADAQSGIDLNLRQIQRGAETELQLHRIREDQSTQLLASAWLDPSADLPSMNLSLDIGAIKARMHTSLAAERDAVAAILPAYRSGLLKLGPRWQTIQSIHLGDHELLAQLALPETYTSDLVHVGLHPALLDCAAGLLAACLIDDQGGVFIPASVREVRQFARLPNQCWTWVRALGDARRHRFDIDLIAADGKVLASMRGFELRAIDAKTPTATPAQASAVPTASAQGLTAEQATTPVSALLALPQSAHVALSLGPVAARREYWRQRSTGALSSAVGAKVKVTGADIMPLHVELAAIWAEQLGLGQVDLDDDFFQVGGNSLSAMQVVARLREKRAQHFDVRALFEHPTLRAFASFFAAQNTGAEHRAMMIPKAPTMDAYPLSPQQQRLWFLAGTGEDAATYNIPVVVRLHGLLNLIRLRRALVKVTERHQMLRTLWFEQDGVLMQSLRTATAPLPVIDLQALTQTDREVELQRLLAADARRGFSWLAEPLHRLALVSETRTQHVLIGCLHHAIADHWSVGNLLADLSRAYDGHVLPVLERDYLDYAFDQQHEQARAARASGLSAWRDALREAPELIELPLDHPRPQTQNSQGARLEHRLPASLCARLERLALEQGASLYMVLLAGFKAMLSGLTGQTHLVVGTPVANRPEAFAPCLGFFANTIAIASRFASDSRFVDVLAAVRQSALDAYAHQDVPFDEVVAAVVPKRRTSYAPLVQCLFVLQNAPNDQAESGSLNLEILDQSTDTAKFDLVLALYQDQAGMRCIVEFRRELFQASSIHALMTRFQRCLVTAASDPECRIPDLAGPRAAPMPAEDSVEEFLL